jgi:hypothetical protein
VVNRQAASPTCNGYVFLRRRATRGDEETVSGPMTSFEPSKTRTAGSA